GGAPLGGPGMNRDPVAGDGQVGAAARAMAKPSRQLSPELALRRIDAIDVLVLDRHPTGGQALRGERLEARREGGLPAQFFQTPHGSTYLYVKAADMRRSPQPPETAHGAARTAPLQAAVKTRIEVGVLRGDSWPRSVSRRGAGRQRLHASIEKLRSEKDEPHEQAGPQRARGQDGGQSGAGQSARDAARDQPQKQWPVQVAEAEVEPAPDRGQREAEG